MNILQSILYGFVSGLSEFIPVSSQAHQELLLKLFGQNSSNPILDIMVDIAVLVSLIFGYRRLSEELQQGVASFSGGIRKRVSHRGNYDLRFVRTATIPLLIGMLVFTYISKGSFSLLAVSVFSLINGLILFIPSRMLHGNKDARTMSALDALLTGLAASLSAFTGISRIGCTASFALARGADSHHALNWALRLSVPALLIWIIIDIFALFTAFQPVGFLTLLGYFLAMGSAFAGGYISISIVRSLSKCVGYSGLAYYSWGAALFAFILYLI